MFRSACTNLATDGPAVCRASRFILFRTLLSIRALDLSGDLHEPTFLIHFARLVLFIWKELSTIYRLVLFIWKELSTICTLKKALWRWNLSSNHYERHNGLEVWIWLLKKCIKATDRNVQMNPNSFQYTLQDLGQLRSLTFSSRDVDSVWWWHNQCWCL